MAHLVSKDFVKPKTLMPPKIALRNAEKMVSIPENATENDASAYHALQVSESLCGGLL